MEERLISAKLCKQRIVHSTWRGLQSSGLMLMESFKSVRASQHGAFAEH